MQTRVAQAQEQTQVQLRAGVRGPRDRGHTGQALPLVLAALLLAGLVGLGLVRLAAASSSRSAAQAAADAAALAGAADGEGAARHLAAVNGAEVVTYRSDGLDVEVVVRRRGVTARARARWVLSAERGRRLRWWDRHPV